MPAKVTKVDLDRLVVRITGEKSRRVSFITSTFMDELADALSDGALVDIARLGKLQVQKQRGTAPPGAPFGGGPRRTDPGVRFRVCFTKARWLRTEIWRKYKEKRFGKTRR